jgi:hypothetical protein
MYVCMYVCMYVYPSDGMPSRGDISIQVARLQVY